MDPKALDRLLPRHEVAPMRATLEWDVRTERSGFKRHEVADEAVVVDLSLEGALIEVPKSGPERAKGDVVCVRLGGASGEATVRHRRESDDATTWLYGIEWAGGGELRDAVENGVEQIRANATAVRRAWEAQRR
jgi:hypothetical protein